MKQFRWQGIIFFLFIFILAIGLSYLAFNENTADLPEDKHTMRVALVNEDEGAIFNGEQIVFGDEFAAGIDKDSRHDWYLVSRGVAESGFDRNAYDMMIIIPNDFSDKSLSIHLDLPEPVSLHYKINATGHESVRAEAEKTAGKILNDFNTRLIDVYFASIIGNLQDAQDNIANVINEEVGFIDTYNNHVHAPLANYTDKFSHLSNHTNNSVENYQGLETVLDSFGESLADDAKNNQEFASEIDSIIKQKSDNSAITNQFNEFFNQFVQNMQNQDVQNNLRQLESLNKLVQKQFLPVEQTNYPDSLVRMDEPQTLLSHTNRLKAMLGNRKSEIAGIWENVEKYNQQLEQVILDGLEKAFEDQEIDQEFDDVLQGFDSKIHTEIQKQINRLPTLSLEEIEASDLTGQTLKDIKETIHISEQYGEEFEFNQKPSNPGLPLSEKISQIKQSLYQDGIEVTDSVEISPEFDQPEVNIMAPVGFTKTSEDVKIKNSKIYLTAKFTLEDVNDSELDVFAPIEWNWEVTQSKEEEMEIEEQNPDQEAEPEQESEKPESEEEIDTGNEEGTEDGVADNNAEHPDEPLVEANSKEQEAENADGDEETPPEHETNPNPEPPTASTSKTITITNNHFKQQVQTSLLTNSTNELIDAAAQTVNEYNKLRALFGLYFGLDNPNNEVQEKKQNPLLAFDPKKSLKEQASEDSLYYLFQVMDFKDLLKDSMGTKITEQITANIQPTLKKLEERIADYQAAVNRTDDHSAQLVETVHKTRDHANGLNEEVTALLTEINSWYETSRSLALDQAIVINNDDDMNTAMMSLQQNYQPLLLASTALQDQAQVNFDSADQVYQTLDALDTEAVSIQESGESLVEHAKVLANDLTNKAVADENFADNFKDVLANSRIGDRQNEHLYSFLANPVQTKNDGVVTERENFTAYFLVLIMAMVTLFTAYVLSNMGGRKITESRFDENVSLMGKNMPATLITTAIGAIEGLIIGLTSFYFLSFEQHKLFIWLGLIVLMTMVMLLIATYLLRQLNMIGMFILLVIFGLYLLLTTSLGFRFENTRLVVILRDVSPLQHAEVLLANVLNGKEAFALLSIIFLLILVGIGFLANLFIFHKGKEGEPNEDTAEAN